MENSIDSTLTELGISLEDAVQIVSKLDETLSELEGSPPPSLEYIKFLWDCFEKTGDDDAEGELADFYCSMKELRISYQEVTAALSLITDEGTKNNALMALSALYVAAFEGLLKMPTVSPTVRRRAHSEQTKPAQAKRSATTSLARAIIERLARTCWEKKPAFRGKKSRTASEIREAVMAEIKAELTAENEIKWPTGWEPADKKTEIGRIIKHIPKW